MSNEIDKFYKNAYLDYFRIKLGDQYNQWAPRFICKCYKQNFPCVSGRMKLKDRLVLEFQWLGTNNKIIMMAVASVWCEM